MTVKEAIEKLKNLPPDAKIEALVVNLLTRPNVGALVGGNHEYQQGINAAALNIYSAQNRG